MHLACRTLVLLIFVQFSNVQCQSGAAEYSRLRSELMNRSVVLNKVPPNVSPRSWNETTLWIFITVVDILNIDQAEQVLNTLVNVDILWSNSELQWRPEDYAGLTIIELESSSMWSPRLLVTIGSRESLYLTTPDFFQLLFNGITVWHITQYLSFRCHFDLTRYPFDVQQCVFGLRPMNRPTPNILLIKFVLNTSDTSELFGEWLLVNQSWEAALSNQNGSFPKITFVLKRKPIYYVIFLLFPMVLTSLLMPLVFLIPARAGEKISYLVAILTSTAIFITLISDAMPRSLSSTPYLAMLLIEVMVEGACAILASLLVITRHEQEENADKSLTVTNSKLNKSSKFDNKIHTDQEPITNKSLFLSRAIPKTSKHLDRLFLILFGLGQMIFLFVLFGLTNWMSDL